MGGHFKIGDNEIRERRADGTEYVRVKTVPAVATEDAMRHLCIAYNEAIGNESFDSLLLSLLFVFDFTFVHPFNDGNGRMSRLLTLLLLYKAGYICQFSVADFRKHQEDFKDLLDAQNDDQLICKKQYIAIRKFFGELSARQKHEDDNLLDLL